MFDDVQLRDPVASLSHLFGFLAGVYFTSLFWRLTRGNRLCQWSVACFGLSMCLLYGASSAYHAFVRPQQLIDFLQRLDHSAVYVLIAGTYTPIFAVLLRGRLRTALLLLMWTVALVGIVCKWLLPLGAFELTVALYLGMGWMGLLSVAGLVRSIGWGGAFYGFLGGVFYTLGAICDTLSWPVLHPGLFRSHELMHILNLVGTFIHVAFMFRYVIPVARAGPARTTNTPST